jgi:hypothetical protein
VYQGNEMHEKMMCDELHEQHNMNLHGSTGGMVHAVCGGPVKLASQSQSK